MPGYSLGHILGCLQRLASREVAGWPRFLKPLAGQKVMVDFEISWFDYVGLNPKSIDCGPLRAENRLFPVLTGSVWAGLKTMIIFELSGSY